MQRKALLVWILLSVPAVALATSLENSPKPLAVTWKELDSVRNRLDLRQRVDLPALNNRLRTTLITQSGREAYYGEPCHGHRVPMNDLRVRSCDIRELLVAVVSYTRWALSNHRWVVARQAIDLATDVSAFTATLKYPTGRPSYGINEISSIAPSWVVADELRRMVEVVEKTNPASRAKWRTAHDALLKVDGIIAEGSRRWRTAPSGNRRANLDVLRWEQGELAKAWPKVKSAVAAAMPRS